jgi:amino acid transporter
MRLAQAQAREELRSFRTAGALMMVGVLGGLLSAFFLLFAIVAALSLLISVWVAALLVALVMAVVCAVLLRSGANLMRRRAAQADASARERTPWTGRATE